MNICCQVDNVVEPVKMDEVNRKAANVLVTQGESAFLEHVFTNPEDHNKPPEERRRLSYAEMRMLYG